MAQGINPDLNIEHIIDETRISNETLNQGCSDEDLLRFSYVCDPWRLVGLQLKLSQEELNAIDEDERTAEEKRVGVLSKWKQRFAFKATYRALVEALIARGKIEQACEICKVLAARQELQDLYSKEVSDYMLLKLSEIESDRDSLRKVISLSKRDLQGAHSLGYGPKYTRFEILLKWKKSSEFLTLETTFLTLMKSNKYRCKLGTGEVMYKWLMEAKDFNEKFKRTVEKAERNVVVSDVTMIRLLLCPRFEQEQETMLFICRLRKDDVPDRSQKDDMREEIIQKWRQKKTKKITVKQLCAVVWSMSTDPKMLTKIVSSQKDDAELQEMLNEQGSIVKKLVDTCALKRVAQLENLDGSWLGIAHSECKDVQDYDYYVDERLQILKKWKKKEGELATTASLATQVMARKGKDSALKVLELSTSKRKCDVVFDKKRIFGYIALAIFIIMAAVIGISTITYGSSMTHASMETSRSENVTHEKKEETQCAHLKEYSHQETRGEAMHNLINITDRPFVGREDDISAIFLKMTRAHIISINGAPGFGKSTLAIHIGYRMVHQGIPVRYVDVTDSLLVSTHHYGTRSQTVKSNSTSMIDKGDLPLGNPLDQLTEKGIDELLSWSKRITSRTLLILDNCDQELVIEQHTKFIEFLQEMAVNANQNLYIIVTSEQHILIVDDFDSWTVKELSHNASVELLLLLAPNISIADAEAVSNLVERCPLALKVVGQLLHDDNDMLTFSLKDELKLSLLNVLNEPSNPKQRFGYLMNTVLKRINLKFNEVLQCGLYFSYFPGSFSKTAALEVVPSKECLLNYAKHSLLDKHILFKTTRYKMHKLIKEYVQVKAIEDVLNTKTLSDKFHLKFHDHYTKFVLQFAKPFIHKNMSDIEEFEFSSESHNIHHLLSILLNLTKFSTDDTHLLVTLVYAQVLKIDELRNHFQHFMKSIIEVCNFLGTDKCAEFFPHITEELLRECQCQNKGIYSFFESVPCNHPSWCKITNTLFDYNRIFRKLDNRHQSYLQRISWWYCLEKNWIKWCARLQTMNTVLLFVSIVMNHIRIINVNCKHYLKKYLRKYRIHINNFDIKRYLNKHVHKCIYVIVYLVFSCSSILAPILALTLENVIASDHFEIILVLLNFFYILCFPFIKKYLFIVANVTLIPLLVLMHLNGQLLDNILRLLLINLIPLVYLFFNYNLDLQTWNPYVSFCSFVFTSTVVLMGNRITLAVLAPFMISSFINMCVLFLLHPRSTSYFDMISCALLLLNFSFSWNIFPICL